jgi:hypothetical protein
MTLDSHFAAELIFAGYRAGMSSLSRSEADAVIMGKQQDISRVIFPGRDLSGGGWGDEFGLGSKLNELIVRHGLACGEYKRSCSLIRICSTGRKGYGADTLRWYDSVL